MNRLAAAALLLLVGCATPPARNTHLDLATGEYVDPSGGECGSVVQRGGDWFAYRHNTWIWEDGTRTFTTEAKARRFLVDHWCKQ